MRGGKTAARSKYFGSLRNRCVWVRFGVSVTCTRCLEFSYIRLVFCLGKGTL
jgi:hypothetical protein